MSTLLINKETFGKLYSIIFLGIIIRQVADLLALMPIINQIAAPSVPNMEVSQDDIYNVQVS